MVIRRRNFLTKLTVGVVALPILRGISWAAEAKGKLGYMKIVDNAALFVGMDSGFAAAIQSRSDVRRHGGARHPRLHA